MSVAPVSNMSVPIPATTTLRTVHDDRLSEDSLVCGCSFLAINTIPTLSELAMPCNQSDAPSTPLSACVLNLHPIAYSSTRVHNGAHCYTSHKFESTPPNTTHRATTHAATIAPASTLLSDDRLAKPLLFSVQILNITKSHQTMRALIPQF